MKHASASVSFSVSNPPPSPSRPITPSLYNFQVAITVANDALGKGRQ